MPDPQVEFMFQNMERANEALIAKIPEDAFVKLYLPLLASTEGGVDLRPWLSISGNALLPVDVCRGEEVLFRVPPLMNTLPTKTRRTTPGDTIDEIAQLAILKSRQHYRLGNAFLQAALEPKVKTDPVNMESFHAWNAILKRYNYPPLLQDVIPSVDTSGVTPLLTDADEIYEDI